MLFLFRMMLATGLTRICYECYTLLREFDPWFYLRLLSRHLVICWANLPPAMLLPQFSHWKYFDVSDTFNFCLSWP